MAKKNKFEEIKKKVTTSGKKMSEGAKNVLKKTTGEQKFLGKTLPKALFKTAKFAFTNPITFTGLTLIPSGIKAIANKQKGLSFASSRQYNKKGRKI